MDQSRRLLQNQTPNMTTLSQPSFSTNTLSTVNPVVLRPPISQPSMLQGQLYLVQNANSSLPPTSQNIWGLPVVNRTLVAQTPSFSLPPLPTVALAPQDSGRPAQPHNGQPCVLLADLTECKSCSALFRDPKQYKNHASLCDQTPKNANTTNSVPASLPAPNSGFSLPLPSQQPPLPSLIPDAATASGPIEPKQEDDPRNVNIVISHEDGSTTQANFTIPICTICKRVFSSTGAVAIHMRTHTGQKPFKCDTCKRRFSQKSSLKRHERIHTGVFPFSCPVCKRRFNDQTNMKKHCKTHLKKANESEQEEATQ